MTGDYIKLKRLNKKGNVQNYWISKKTLKKYEHIRVIDKNTNKSIDVLTPKIKISKNQPKIQISNIPGKSSSVTLHIKIAYDSKLAGKYVPKHKEFYLEGFITRELNPNEIKNKVPLMEAQLKDKINSEFFGRDSKATLLNHPFYTYDNDEYESGLEYQEISGSPSSQIIAGCNYRYSSNSLLKSKQL